MLGWTALAIVAIGFLYRAVSGYPRPQQRYGTLIRPEVAFVAAAADAMFPAGGAIPVSGLEAGIPGYVDRLFLASHARIRFLMRLLLLFFEHATLIFPAPGRGGMKRFSALDKSQQLAVFDAWSGSSLFPRRLVFVSLRSILAMGYFHHPPVVRQLGLAPLAIDTPVCQADLWMPAIGKGPESIRYTREDVNAPVEVGVPLERNAPLHADYSEEAS